MSIPSERRSAGDPPPGSIRGDYALEVGSNMVHGSDSGESAAREAALFFPELG